MSAAKAYIFEYEKVETRVCAYSEEMFSAVMKGVRKEEDVWVGGETEAHEDSEGRCACQERIAAVSETTRARLRGYEKAVVGLELVAVGGRQRRLLVCEVSPKKGPGGRTRVKVVPVSGNLRKADGHGKYCLLALTQILLVDLTLEHCNLAGRNNSLSTKAAIFKDCYKEVARELAGKGALPSAISQKSLRSRDTNRCWFDFGRIMDICIHYKLGAKDIAELIKHIASIDPMQPDPVVCIKDRFGTTGHHSRTGKRDKGLFSDISDITSSSQSSSQKSSSSSSNTSELIVSKSRSSSQLKNKRSKMPEIFDKKKHRSKSQNKSITKETQTSNCTQSETQTEFFQCKCFKTKPNQKLLYPSENERYINKYLWNPNYYEGIEYEEPTNYDDECIEEPLIFDDDNDDDDGQYLQTKEMEKNPSIKNNFQNLPQHRSNYEDGNYDSQMYEDFLRQSDYLDNEDDFDIDVEQPHMYSGFKQKCNPDGRQKRLNTLNTRLQPSRQMHPQITATNPTCMKYNNGSYNRDQLRSNSQPLLPTKSQSFRLVGNSSNSQEYLFQHNLLKDKVISCSKTAVDSYTQTSILSSNVSTDEAYNAKMKKCASESNICQKISIESNVNNSTRDSLNALSHVGVNTSTSLNTSKMFKVGFAQTEYNIQNEEDMHQNQHGLYIPKFLYRKGVHLDYYLNSPKQSKDERNVIIPNKSQSIPYTDQNYQSKNIIYDGSFQLNRNANNHSISRSPSSRNSQIVEVDNENMEKISSVIIDHESRPIVYFGSKDQNYTDYLSTYHVDYNPFYEKDENFSDCELEKYNTNINNSIRSVTVCNKEPLVFSKNKCSIEGCQNLVDECNYKCENHGTIQSSSCSPERCLSRLSCIISLNRQFVDHNMSPEESFCHKAVMRRIYGTYDETNCAETFVDVIPQQFENYDLIKDLLPVKGKNILPHNDFNSRQRKTCDLTCDGTEHQFLSVTKSGSTHSALKVTKGNYIECHPIELSILKDKHICNLSNFHSPAQIVYQSIPEEIMTPNNSYGTLNIKHANVKCRLKNLNKSVCVSCPLSNIAELTKYRTTSPFCNISKRNCINISFEKERIKKPLLCDIKINFENKNVKHKINDTSAFIMQDSCNLTFPLNLQVCPVSGCKNITTTGKPLCIKLNESYKKLKNPDTTENSLYVDSPYLTVDLITKSSESKSPLLNTKGIELESFYDTKSQIINGKIYNDENNDIILNDTLDNMKTPFSIHERSSVPLKNKYESLTPRRSNVNPHEQPIIANSKKITEIIKSEPNFSKYKEYDDYDRYPSNITLKTLYSDQSLRNVNIQSQSEKKIVDIERNEDYEDDYYDPYEMNLNTLSIKKSIKNNKSHKIKKRSVKNASILQFGDENDENNLTNITSNKLNKNISIKTSKSSKSQSKKSASTLDSEPEYEEDDYAPSELLSNKINEKMSVKTLQNVDVQRLSDKKVSMFFPEETYNESSKNYLKIPKNSLRDTNSIKEIEDTEMNRPSYFNSSILNTIEEKDLENSDKDSRTLNDKTEADEVYRQSGFNSVMVPREENNDMNDSEYPEIPSIGLSKENPSKRLKSFNSIITSNKDNKDYDIFPSEIDSNNLILSSQKSEFYNSDLRTSKNSNVTVKLNDKLEKMSDKDSNSQTIVMESPEQLYKKPFRSINDNKFDHSDSIYNNKTQTDISLKNQISKTNDPYFIWLDSDNFPKPSYRENFDANDIQQTALNDVDSLLKNSTTIRISKTLESIYYNDDQRNSIDSNTSQNLKSFIKNVSVSNKQTMDNVKPWTNTNIDPSISNIPISTVNNHSQSHENHNSFLEKNYWMNNSSLVDFIYNNNQQKELNYFYLDDFTTNVFSGSIIFKDPKYLIFGKCEIFFYSTPELIQNRHLNRILVSERWDICSDIILENLDNITISLPVLIDHPNNKIFLLISLSVLLLFCKQIPVLMHTAQLQHKSKKSKIIRLFRSIRSPKSQQSKVTVDQKLYVKNQKVVRTELLKEFKNKMVKIVKKCKIAKFRCNEKSAHTSSFSTNFVDNSKLLDSSKSEIECNTSLPSSYSLIDQTDYSSCTQSCMEFGRQYNKCIGNHKCWKSEPVFNKYSHIWIHSTETLQGPFSSAGISTSDLSLLCAQVLKKIEAKYIINYRITKKEISIKELCTSSTFMKCQDTRCSSKDTMRLIIKALKYLHRSHLEDGAPSNKTLDSVSSIKTCSGDCAESLSSLKMKIFQPYTDDNIVISAFNKTL